MTTRSKAVSLCGTSLEGLQHVCAFFDSREEQYEVLTPYFREGLDQGDEVLTIVESSFHDDHVSRMRRGGVPVDGALASGQLKIVPSEQTYIKDDIFVVDRMYSLLEQALDSARRGTYGSVRTCGDMEWALRNLPGTDELMVYEARVNMLAPKHDCTLLCVYDVNRFSGRVVADVLATHSHVILGGRIHVNPYFVEPMTFLKKLSLRRASVSPLKAGL